MLPLPDMQNLIYDEYLKSTIAVIISFFLILTVRLESCEIKLTFKVNKY